MRILYLLLALCLGAATPAAQVVSAADHGVVAGPGIDNGPAIERAAQAACDAGTPTPADGSIPTRLPVVRFGPGIYEYVNVAVPCDVEFQGVGGGVAVSVPGSAIPLIVEASSLGRPETRLRVKTGWAAEYAAGNAPASRFQLVPEPHTRRQVSNVNWRIADRTYHALSFRDLVLDGNETEAVAAFAPMPADWKEQNLRNGAAHSGVVAGNEGGTNLCTDQPRVVYVVPTTGYQFVRQATEPGARVSLHGVVVTGYTATGILGSACSRWHLDHVRLGRAAYNHAAYNADGGVTLDHLTSPLNGWGGWKNTTIVPLGWTDIVTAFGLDATAIRVAAGTPSPLREAWEGPDFINSRGVGATFRGLVFDAPLGVSGMPRVFTYADTTAGGSWPVLVRPLPAAYESPVPVPAPAPAPPPAPRRYVIETFTSSRCRDTVTGRIARMSYCTPDENR